MIHAFSCGPVSTNCYVVTNPERGVAVLIDAPPESWESVRRALEDDGCRLTDILLTHTHWDHTVDCFEIQKATGAKVWVHSNDAYRLLDPNRHTVWPLPFEIEPVTNFVLFENAVESRWENSFSFRVLETPGHTEGGVCFVDDVEKLVFAGDTLFNGSVGRTDLPGGDMSTLVESIRNTLFMLDDEYQVLPGHGPATTIGAERKANVYVGDFAE